MSSLPYNLFLNATFAQSFRRSVREDGSSYRLATIRIGFPELNIGTFCVTVILSVQQNEGHLAPQIKGLQGRNLIKRKTKCMACGAWYREVA